MPWTNGAVWWLCIVATQLNRICFLESSTVLVLHELWKTTLKQRPRFSRSEGQCRAPGMVVPLAHYSWSVGSPCWHEAAPRPQPLRDLRLHQVISQVPAQFHERYQLLLQHLSMIKVLSSETHTQIQSAFEDYSCSWIPLCPFRF